MSTNEKLSLRLRSEALLLSYITVGYNVLEGVISGVISIIAGALAGSIALIGFGLDSFVESLSGGVMIWRFSKQSEISKVENEIFRRLVIK